MCRSSSQRVVGESGIAVCRLGAGAMPSSRVLADDVDFEDPSDARFMCDVRSAVEILCERLLTALEVSSDN